MNVLAAGHEELSVQFARSGADKFAGVDWRAAPSGSPVLDGVSAWIDCTLWNEYDGGDHTVGMAELQDMNLEDGERGPDMRKP